MTHSHDRTLLASLSFADPDKRESLHDLACEYFAEKEQAQRLAKLFGGARDPVDIRAHTEVMLSKGMGQYQSTIGFLDAVIHWRDETKLGQLVVEVKIHRATIGDLNVVGKK